VTSVVIFSLPPGWSGLFRSVSGAGAWAAPQRTQIKYTKPSPRSAAFE
jgi:hypothetical protein